MTKSIDEEFMGILNYSIIALIQLNKSTTLQLDTLDESVIEYKKHSIIIKNLMEQKIMIMVRLERNEN